MFSRFSYPLFIASCQLPAERPRELPKYFDEYIKWRLANGLVGAFAPFVSEPAKIMFIKVNAASITPTPLSV
jgi:hypothetical protein